MTTNNEPVSLGQPSALILLSLSDGPKHGYGITLDVAEQAGVRLGPGTLYGALSRLEEQGLIAALPAQGRRRPYELTGAGRTALTPTWRCGSKLSTPGTPVWDSRETVAAACLAARLEGPVRR